MKKVMSIALAVALAFLLWPGSDAQAGKPCVVPKDWWGRVAAVSTASLGSQLVTFEAEDGTVRIINADCGSPAKAAYTIERQQ